MSYMTVSEIRELSRRIPDIINATQEEIEFWIDEAFDVINNYCQQDFVFEKQTIKSVRATNSTLVYLPKVLSGEVTVYNSGGQSLFSTTGSSVTSSDPFSGGETTISGSSSLIELFPGNFVIGYYGNNALYPSPNARQLLVKGDWGYQTSTTTLIVDFINTIKLSYEAHRVNVVVHPSVDALNVFSASNATDLDTTIIQLNTLKGVINSHMGDFVVHSNSDANICTVPDAIDEASAFLLAQDLKVKFNAHLKRDQNTSPAIHLATDLDNVSTANTDNTHSVMPRVIRRAFLRLVQRIAIRDDAEDHRQINSVYTNETLGDGYTYDLTNGTLRNLIRPEEAHMLLPYVNRGRIVI